MPDSIPIPGTTKAKLIHVGLRLFSEQGYAHVEVDQIAQEAGVTIGALYHHFKSKVNFYGVLRDDMGKRILDRMEAAAESVAPDQALRAAVLSSFDGIVRIKAGKLLIEPDPRGGDDVIANYLGELATAQNHGVGKEIGVILAAAVRAALAQGLKEEEGLQCARQALEYLLP